jgi:hypothetical protein
MASEDSELPDLKFSSWRRKLEAAMIETDPEKLRHLIDDAEAAIFLRSQELALSSDGHAEQHAISDAIRTLRILQAEKLNYPDWNKK